MCEIVPCLVCFGYVGRDPQGNWPINNRQCRIASWLQANHDVPPQACCDSNHTLCTWNTEYVHKMQRAVREMGRTRCDHCLQSACFAIRTHPEDLQIELASQASRKLHIVSRKPNSIAMWPILYNDLIKLKSCCSPSDLSSLLGISPFLQCILWMKTCFKGGDDFLGVFSVWGSFPCYLLHFGAKISDSNAICCVLELKSRNCGYLLSFGTKILHVVCYLQHVRRS